MGKKKLNYLKCQMKLKLEIGKKNSVLWERGQSQLLKYVSL